MIFFHEVNLGGGTPLLSSIANERKVGRSYQRVPTDAALDLAV